MVLAGHHGDHRCGFREPLEGSLPPFDEAETGCAATDQGCHQRMGQGATVSGGIAQPCGFDHRGAEPVAVLLEHLSDADAHPQLERVLRVETLCDRVHRRRTFKSAHRAALEHRHETVTECLDDQSVGGAHGSLQQGEQAPAVVIRADVTEPHLARGGADDITEQHRDGCARFHDPPRTIDSGT